MSDLFARLGARALGVPGAVRPAIVSLFLPRSSWPAPDEPQRGADGPALGDDEGHEGAPAVMAPAPPVPHRAAAAVPNPVSPDPMAASAPERQEDVSPRKSPPRRARVGLPRVVELPAPQRNATPAPDSAASRGAAMDAPRSARTRLGRAIDTAGVVSGTSTGLASGTPMSTGPGLMTRPRERSAGEHAPVPGAPGLARAEREESEALARLRQLGTPPVAPRSPAGETATPERVVRISIGRIDVRAVPAPASPPAVSRAREPARPRPSLEDYLAKKGRERA